MDVQGLNRYTHTFHLTCILLWAGRRQVKPWDEWPDLGGFVTLGHNDPGSHGFLFCRTCVLNLCVAVPVCSLSSSGTEAARSSQCKASLAVYRVSSRPAVTLFKTNEEPGVVVHIFNPSIMEAEAGDL